jgi:hypothetical protein
MSAKNKLKNKMLSGAAAPDRFAAAEAAMAKGGIVAPTKSDDFKLEPSPPDPPRVSKKVAVAGKKRSKAPGSLDLVVRDTFSMPEPDYAVIARVRNKAGRKGHIYTKSEVVRAALQVLGGLPEGEVMQQLAAIEKLKPGRKN